VLLVDPRRLTGPNLLSRSPLVVVELALDVADVFSHARDVYLAELGRMRSALGMPHDVVPVIVRAHRGGAVIAYEEPIDVMLPCTEMSEWAALSACEILGHRAPLSLEPKRTEIAAMLAKDRSPRLVALQAEAKKRNVPFFWDDEAISVGAGSRSQVWPRHELPDVADVDWSKIGGIPIALVTGTNGKTTSTRLLARVVREAGHRVGSTTSDAVVIGDKTLEEGDWTGPAAARTVLRNPDVDFAVLETARGGILRRGLAMDWCDAALITNVSEDHTGGYGIDDLAAMTRVKAVTAQAVRKNGHVVLNAHDPKLVALEKSLDPEVVFFADLDAGDSAARAVLETHRARGGASVYAEAGAIVIEHGTSRSPLLRVDEVPITFGGAAPHNVENVLGVVAMADSLGLSEASIKAALRGFQQTDNPGRGDVFEHDGVRVMLDFGHNPAGVRKVLRLVESLRRGSRPDADADADADQGRLFVCAASAGDRSDHEISEMCGAIADAEPEHVFVRELTGYLRGRIPGQVPRLIRHELVGHGVAAGAITLVDGEVACLERATSGARAGDFVLVLVHLERTAVTAFLARAGYTKP
jgi:UDP-N-acetylmuramyl tripeptide synthase